MAKCLRLDDMGRALVKSLSRDPFLALVEGRRRNFVSLSSAQATARIRTNPVTQSRSSLLYPLLLRL